MKRVAIVGLGLIGKERYRAVQALRSAGRDIALVALFDPYSKDIDAMAMDAGATVCASVAAVVAAKPDLTVVAVPHDIAAETCRILLDAGLRVLLEKPLGRSLSEAEAIAKHATLPDQLMIGHNYRFFGGVAALAEDISSGVFGTPIGLTFLLGHGGSPADKATWKLDPIRAGGGCLIDPGIHLLDLAVQFDGQGIDVIGGTSWSGFWGTGIEEDCRFVFAGRRIPSIDLHVSVARWRSTFRLEYFGVDGYGIVEGRGRSYGPQTYRRGKRWGWQSGVSQPDSEELVVTTNGDDSFAKELDAVLFGATGPQAATLEQSLLNMRLLEACRSAAGLPSPDFT